MAKKPKQPANAAVPAQPSAGADLSHLERMLAFMEQHGLEEFEYEHAGLRVRLRRPSANTHHPSALPARAFGMGAMTPPEILVGGSASPAAESASGASSRSEPSGTATADAEDLHVVKSPI